MPVLFDSEPSGCIKIGLINNMSDEALKATERQFVSLLNSASDNMPIHLSLYTLPGVPRTALPPAISAAATRTSKTSGTVISMG
jgi:hypothetical protein